VRHIENAKRAWNERGLALPLAVICLLTVTGLVLTFLTVSAIEPQISANHARGTQARYAAEAGIEWGFDYLVRTPDWNAVLAGATGTGRDITPGAPWAGATPVLGTFTLIVRNDWRAADSAITGVPRDSSGAPTTDTNNVLLVTATGSFRGAMQTITAAVRKGVLPTTNAALAFPGLGAGVDFAHSAFTIDGTDSNLDASAGAARPVYGISVAGGATGNQTLVRDAVAANTQNQVRGLSATSATAPAAATVASGESAIASDGALTSSQILEFVDAVKAQADVTIDVSNGTRATVAGAGGSCADVGSRTCWGTLDYPKIVYVKGGLTGSPGIAITGNSEGTGVLIVDSAEASIEGPFRWNGPIILTGHNVSLRYGGSGSGDIFGAVIINELATTTTSVQLGSDAARPAAIRYSRQALDLVDRGLSRRFVHLYSWREH
jgi:hypothetical protein